MAYAQPPRDGRSPPDHMHEASRSSWSTTYSHRPPPYQAPHMHSSTSTLAPLDHMDPESSDSDISRTGEDPYRIASPPAMPVQLPPPPPKHILESADNVQTRLRELTQVEDHNIRKQEVLLAKRRRKDDKIARKREMQDRKIKAIMDARERRDTRINSRRAREDAAFRAVDDQIEEEEMSLRRRLKRLKRGLPFDESHQHGRSTSTISMSPPGPAFSTVPPPPKRHQSGPPSRLDNIRPHQQASFPPPPPNPTPTPSYSFAQSSQPYNAPSHAGPSYSTLPPAGPPLQQNVPPLSASGPHDRFSYAINGRPASPAPRPHLHSSAASSQNTPPANPPSRQPSSTYDTRPPPSTSGFASINAPTTSGFAAINPRSAATPPGSYSSLAKPADAEANRTPASGPHRDQPLNYPPSQRANSGNDGTPTSNHVGSTPATGKRTPSTTHPYQMSEAFANRHHHCERVDSLNRGIWTSHGPGGTQENPTGPPVEMYLRCNHDDCRRIDWRTVHGLQCHIVKNHEQPKGTIGSLEKALDRYGVPIREVEEYERGHGEGTGGTMADPKNLKIKNKTREAVYRKSTPASHGVDPTARPAGYKPPPQGVQESPTIANTTPRSSTGSVIRRSHVQEESTYSDTDDSGSVPTVLRKSGPGPSTNRFEAVGVDRAGDRVSVPANPPAGVDANHQLQGDAVMKDVVPSSSWKHWAPANRAAEAVPKPYSYPSPKPSHTVSNDSIPPPSIPSSTVAPVPTAQSIIPSTQTQAMVEEVKKVEEKQAMEDETVATPNATQSQDTDAQMTGVSETQPASEVSQEATVEGEKKKDTDEGRTLQTAGDSTNGLMPVDGEQAKIEIEIEGLQDTEPKDDADAIAGPAKATRAAFQSPTITTKPLDPPRSAKRISRRSSAARKLSGDSTDGQTDIAKIADGVDGEVKDYERDPSTRDGSTKGGADEDMDGDSITVAPSRGSLRKKRAEAMRASLEELESNTPPKRTANGRFTRKRTLV